MTAVELAAAVLQSGKTKNIDVTRVMSVFIGIQILVFVFRDAALFVR